MNSGESQISISTPGKRSGEYRVCLSGRIVNFRGHSGSLSEDGMERENGREYIERLV